MRSRIIGSMMLSDFYCAQDAKRLASAPRREFVTVHDSRATEEILHVFSDIDISSGADFESALAGSLVTGKKTVVDLTECPYIDSTGLRLLVRARRAFGSDLEIWAARGSTPEKILVICGLDSALSVVFQPARPQVD